jgi:hypothetical protein
MESDYDWSQREDVQAIFAHIDSPWGFEAFQRQVANANNCAHPVRLSGSALTYDAETGERIGSFDSGELPDGVLLKACGNRRASRCPPCAHVHKEDARHLVSAGLIGGKGVPESVSERTSLMVTLTGPGFGPALGGEGPSPTVPPGITLASLSARAARGLLLAPRTGRPAGG